MVETWIQFWNMKRKGNFSPYVKIKSVILDHVILSLDQVSLANPFRPVKQNWKGISKIQVQNILMTVKRYVYLHEFKINWNIFIDFSLSVFF